MIRTYPQPPAEAARAGQPWVFCDAEGCTNDAQIADITEYPVKGGVAYEAPMPEGWATSDPDDNALAGAAQFCPTHTDRLPPPVVPEPDPVEPPVVPTPEPTPEPDPAS
ncbi:MAG: hypothetical protein WKF96_19080 [Solirubrobacteraceae bacterium]